jgi:uncharacterized damage-inducible protein DinB
VSREGVAQLVYLLDRAFADSDHSLLDNVLSLKVEDWTTRPPGSKRSILAIFGHAVSTKYLYWNHAFGDGSVGWTDPVLNPMTPGSTFSAELMLEWARRVHEHFREAVSLLDDSDLSEMRYASIWDQRSETRWFISSVIEHDLYHAGEINHLRALIQQNDDWPRA